MVRNKSPTLNEPNERTRGTSVPPEQASPEQACAPRRSFALAHSKICDPLITREVIARADADFARIFSSRE
jgi:hypothetical protein